LIRCTRELIPSFVDEKIRVLPPSPPPNKGLRIPFGLETARRTVESENSREKANPCEAPVRGFRVVPIARAVEGKNNRRSRAWMDWLVRGPVVGGVCFWPGWCRHRIDRGRKRGSRGKVLCAGNGGTRVLSSRTGVENRTRRDEDSRILPIRDPWTPNRRSVSVRECLSIKQLEKLKKVCPQHSQTNIHDP